MKIEYVPKFYLKEIAAIVFARCHNESSYLSVYEELYNHFFDGEDVYSVNLNVPAFINYSPDIELAYELLIQVGRLSVGDEFEICAD